MPKQYKDHHEYARDLAPTLDAALAKQRDSKFEAAVAEAWFLFCFVMNDFGTKTTLRADLFESIGIMLIELEDVLRGILHGQRVLSPVVLATLTRVALELRCKLRFIFSRQDPAVYADRYVRHAMIETLAYYDGKAAGESKLSSEERDWIAKCCPEWIVEKKGRRTFRTNWTAESAFASVKTIAKEVGLAEDYQGAYSMTSKYVHGSATLLGLYGGPDGSIGSLGQPLQCKQMTYLGVNYCMETLRDAAKFFGVALDPTAFSSWQERLAAACPELDPQFAARPVARWE